MTSSLPPGYFDRMYADSADPWDFSGRWYERRKRAITLASLPRERFRRAFEPGCSIGLLSEALAERCDELLATDVSPTAVAATAERLARFPAAEASRLRVPQEWPEGEFDLIVLSEIAYYCSESDALALGRAAAGSLTADGILVLCHWLHDVTDYPLTGARAQELVREGAGLTELARHEEADFILEIRGGPLTWSVATVEGLLGDLPATSTP